MWSKSLLLLLPILICQLTKAQVNGKYLFERNNSISLVDNSDTLIHAWAGGLNSIQVSKMDLDEDGIEDLFIFDRTGDKILTFLWDVSDNDWKYAPEFENVFPDLNYWTLLRDYNCDGKKDIFSYVSGGIGVWKNISTPGQIEFVKVTDPFVRSTLLGGTVANLYVSKVDIPDINDVDGDGDLDVLTFGNIGQRVEYHMNMSQELGYGCDSLTYEIANTCWGHFLETGFSTNTCILYDTCSTNATNPKGSNKHSGSSVLSLDLNDDGVKDLLLGDVSFNNVVGLFNDNKGVNMNTSFVAQDTAFPNGTAPIDIHIYPACFYEDIDNDGINDLIASTNTEVGSVNFESSWKYKNYGTNTNPVFAHIKSDWLQDEMLEVGNNAYPILFDFNNDGLEDLFIGNLGYFDVSLPSNYYSQISLYENVGTANQPSFSLVTDDFASLSTLGMEIGLYPTFADIDNDGDVDMIVGDQEGFIHLFTNSSNSMNSMSMSLLQGQYPDDIGDKIDVGYAAKPQLFDIDGDGDFDLFIGEENGNLNYFENIGAVNAPIFRLQSANFGGVNVSEWWTTIGNSSPMLFKNNQNITQLMVGSYSGAIFHYNDIDNNILGTFNIQDTIVGRINIGPNASPALGFMNTDTILDIIVGNQRGGISYFQGSADPSLGIHTDKQPRNWKLYPNPTKDLLNIDIPDSYSNLIIDAYDLSGKLILSAVNSNMINVSSFADGVYLLKVTID
ncbi:MAG: hypothetical protein ACI9N1_002338, partial [Flavobacteriales bacterium]